MSTFNPALYSGKINEPVAIREMMQNVFDASVEYYPETRTTTVRHGSRQGVFVDGQDGAYIQNGVMYVPFNIILRSLQLVLLREWAEELNSRSDVNAQVHWDSGTGTATITIRSSIYKNVDATYNPKYMPGNRAGSHIIIVNGEEVEVDPGYPSVKPVLYHLDPAMDRIICPPYMLQAVEAAMKELPQEEPERDLLIMHQPYYYYIHESGEERLEEGGGWTQPPETTTRPPHEIIIGSIISFVGNPHPGYEFAYWRIVQHFDKAPTEQPMVAQNPYNNFIFKVRTEVWPYFREVQDKDDDEIPPPPRPPDLFAYREPVFNEYPPREPHEEPLFEEPRPEFKEVRPEFTEAEPVFESDVRVIQKYLYFFGLDELNAKENLINTDCCRITREMDIGENDYVELEAEYFADEYSAVEFSIIDHITGIETPILPVGEEMVKNEKIFPGKPLRFSIDSSRPFVLKKDGVIQYTGVGLPDEAPEDGYTIDYYPMGNFDKVFPANSKVRVKVVLRFYKQDQETRPPHITRIAIRKYGGQALWQERL